jgi:uncharacterized DUF497 family protein
VKFWDFELIDWDDEDDENGNLAHCREHGVDEHVVAQVLAEQPVRVRKHLNTAEFVVVGPDFGGTLWTLLFDWSFKRGDWLRPVTGWEADDEERAAWRQAMGKA